MKKNESFLLSLGPNEKESDQAFPNTIVKDFLIPFGTLLVGAVGFLAGYEKLPGWALGLVIAYFALTAVISLASPAKWIFQWYMGRRTEKSQSHS